MEFQKKCIDKSEALYKRALEVIPGASQTAAKGPTQFINGVAPKYLEKGSGSHVWDVDGNEYIDYCMGIGPIVLGYSYPVVNNAIAKQLAKATTFSLIDPKEVELAELLVDVIPSAESVRYGKNGCDVTAAAIRLARAYTNKDHVITCGYHGFHDWCIGITSKNKGVPKAIQQMTHRFTYNDIGSLEELFATYQDQIACVIMEPIAVEAPKEGFLQKVKEVTHKNNALLIFDEIWTGFRFDLGGVQKMAGVTPDLSTFSKAMANGMPISALVGKKEIMELFTQDVFFYLTFGGECLSLAAAIATIQEIRKKNVVEHLAKQGQKILQGYNKIVAELKMEEFSKCVGYPYRTLVTFDGKDRFAPLIMKSLVQQELIKRGILWSGFHVLSFSHSDDDIELTLEAYEDALKILKKAMEQGSIESFLEGKPILPVF